VNELIGVIAPKYIIEEKRYILWRRVFRAVSNI